jgi:NADPH:quinone reductase-like Zn-dependent oxidoreductase
VLFRFGTQRLGRFLVSPRQEDLVFLKDLIEAGKLTPVIDHSYPLAEAREAMAHVDGGKARGGHARGKVTITVGQAPAAVEPVNAIPPVALAAVA